MACKEDEHSYEHLERYYYKIENGRLNQDISYTMLYCKKCGDSKEVIAQDHREKK